MFNYTTRSRVLSFASISAVCTAFLCMGTLHAVAAPIKEVKMLVVRENGTGSSSSAKVYLDKFFQAVGAQTGWAVTGAYKTKRHQAKSYIASENPDFGILSLPTYLALRETNKLKVVGQVDSSVAGGAQYHIVSATKTSLNECVSGSVASNHFGDVRFINNVVARGAFAVTQLHTVETKRPMQTLKKVARGEADCALIDDAQLKQLEKSNETSTLKPVWSSVKLPAMAVVAFSQTNSTDTKALRSKLTSVCQINKQICSDVGIRNLKPASQKTYGDVTKRY